MTNTMGKITNFEKIKEVKDLVSYLEDARRDKDFFYHYTTLDRLELILKNKTFVLSSFSEMNDRYEEVSLHADFTRNAYVGSFSRAENEVMAMWGMYSIPWEKGVRIGIPRSVFRQWIRELEYVHAFEDGKVVGKFPVQRNQKKINAVCYYDKINNRLDWSTRRIYLGKAPGLKNPLTIQQLNGYVKHKTWATEEEIRVLLTPQIPDLPKRIVLDIPDYMISNIRIVLGPSFNLNDYQSRLEALNVPYELSEFTGMVKLKDICEECRYKSEFLRTIGGK